LSDPRLIKVQSRVVKEVLVERLAALASEREGDSITAAAAPLLDMGPEPQPADALAAALARNGYASRIAESELLEPARTPAVWLGELVAGRIGEGQDWPAAVAATSRELADTEPLDRPEPGDDSAVTWRVPGPGGHVRHYVAMHVIAERAPTGRANRAYKRDFLYGFMVRCCEEAVPTERDG
jgi:hypothetical protein